MGSTIRGTRSNARFGLALALAMLSAVPAADAVVVWGDVDRTIYAGNHFQFINPPQPPTFNVNSETMPGEGPWNRRVTNTTGMTNSSAGQDTTISFASNSIVGVGTSSWTNPFIGIGTRQSSFARTEIIASFTVDEPTLFMIDHAFDFNGPPGVDGRGELRSPSGTAFIFTGTDQRQDVLAPGTWTLTLFAGMPIPTENTAFFGHGNFDVNFRLVPEPAVLPGSVACATLMLARRRRRRWRASAAPARARA